MGVSVVAVFRLLLAVSQFSTCVRLIVACRASTSAMNHNRHSIYSLRTLQAYGGNSRAVARRKLPKCGDIAVAPIREEWRCRASVYYCVRPRRRKRV